MADDKKTSVNKTELVKFRVTRESKQKLLEHFGSYSAIRDYVLEVVEGKGGKVKREVKK